VAPATVRIMPRTETIVMLATVAITVLTHNLAYGVGAGVALSAVFFVRHVSHVVNVTSVVDPDNVERLYAVTGELFFASTHDIVHAFDYDAVKVKRVEIDLTDARIWDTSAVAALDTVVEKFSQRDIEAVLVGMNRHAERLHTSTSGNVTVH
jgi:SulP family sulfate permease